MNEAEVLIAFGLFAVGVLLVATPLIMLIWLVVLEVLDRFNPAFAERAKDFGDRFADNFMGR